MRLLKRGSFRSPFCVLLVVLAASAFSAEAANRSVTRQVSVNSQGNAGNEASDSPAFSGNGRWIAFQSAANNLVRGDVNQAFDIFIYDTRTRSVRLVSQNSSGEAANGDCLAPTVSSDGRVVAFQSTASNLVSSDTNAQADIFVRDLASGTTELVSVSTAHGAANGGSRAPSISGDGRYVAFESWAGNLVPNDTNGAADIFVRDRIAGTTIRASVGSDGAQAANSSLDAALSGDGRYVAFRSPSPGLVPGDETFGQDCFVRDLIEGATERISRLPGNPNAFNLGGTGRPALSEDGRFVAFDTTAALVSSDTDSNSDVYVRDRLLDTVERISSPLSGSVTDHNSTSPTLSSDGRYVAFYSGASNLVALPADYRMHLFVRDRTRNTTELASLAANGLRESGEVSGGAISGDGGAVAFVSERFNPTTGMPRSQIYLRTRRAPVRTPPTRLEIRGSATFPTIPVGGYRTRLLLLTNRGPVTLHGTVGEVTAPFHVDSGSGYFTLPPGGSHPVEVSFEPSMLGHFQATLNVAVDGNPSTSRAIKLKGKSK